MSDSLKVTLVQTELLWEDIQGNLQLLEKKMESISETDLIVLPEMFTTGFTMSPQNLAEPMEGPTVSWMKALAQAKNAVICGSAIITESGHYYNRFIAAYPGGESVIYDKKHLFTLAGEDKSYQPGDQRVVFEVKGWTIRPMICYDLRFPVWARSRRADSNPWEYDLLLYVANWPKPRTIAWDTLLQARAIENQAYCVGVNRIGTDANGLEYVGHSAVYDYAGLAVMESGESNNVQTVTLNKPMMDSFRQKLPFQKDGDDFRINTPPASKTES